MFNSLLKTNYINNLQDEAKLSKIKENRDIYNKYFLIIEKYIFDNNLIISDINTLIDEESIYKNTYNIYTENSFKYSNELVNLLAKETNSKWFSLWTQIPHIYLSIKYKDKILITINSLSITNYHNITNPVKFKGFFIEKELLFLPYEVELIEIYTKLYNPVYNEEWLNLIEIEPKLIEKTKIRIENKELIKNISFEGGNPDIDTIKKIIIFKILPETDFILIGKWAVILIEYGMNNIEMNYI